ncbi:class I SAM-dependent methyltransferase [Roseococcus sp. YIM B11640]|uniref:class I SAM-dependent methyltransferase n=1 Tax=Roseococcus sp. YIM B11640 TaxID=3133973 RepID=UPI003C7CC7DA
MAQGLSSWHQAGNLPPRVVDFLWNAIDLHFPGGLNLSVETGCGLSTLMLDHKSQHHICFTIGENDNSLQSVKASGIFKGENTQFVLGPSQKTLHDLPDIIRDKTGDAGNKIDFALIDGAHAYPFVEMDYWHIYPYLNSWSLLAVDDIHIPTITRFYEFLREEDMFDFYGVIQNTALFVRNATEIFDPYGDGWERQGFNKRHFKP